MRSAKSSLARLWSEHVLDCTSVKWICFRPGCYHLQEPELHIAAHGGTPEQVFGHNLPLFKAVSSLHAFMEHVHLQA